MYFYNYIITGHHFAVNKICVMNLTMRVLGCLV